jgi:hypothetical protein
MFPWQVFGLYRLIPTCQTSQAYTQCHLAFVPAYRCGAVPEFHRIPFSPSVTGETVEALLYLDPCSCATQFVVDIQSGLSKGTLRFSDSKGNRWP